MRCLQPRAPVLVTGATGFVGRHVARRLLADGYAVIALARRRGGEPAAARVARAIGAPRAGRLEVVESEPDRPSLDPRALARLRCQVELVVHCAGDARFFPDDLAAHRASHVDHPLLLLTALAGGRLRTWAHLSTAFVCGRRSGIVLECEGDVGQTFHNPYEQVKLEAEARLRDAGERFGVDVRVLRPSIVVGAAPDTAGGTPSALFLEFIRVLARIAPRLKGIEALRLPAQPAAPFNIVPVEAVARCVAPLAEHPDGAGGTFHVVVHRPPAQHAVFAMLTRRLGLEPLRLLPAGGTEPLSPIELAMAKRLRPYADYLEQHVSFDDRRARRLLADYDVAAPTLGEAAIERLIVEACATAR